MNDINPIILDKNKELINKSKIALGEAKKIAIDEAWRLLQLTTASIVQAIETYANELSGPEKKVLAINLINAFYDSVFTIVKIPFVPPFLDAIIHQHVKSILMIMVGASIDAIVKIFRDTGVFITKGVK